MIARWAVIILCVLGWLMLVFGVAAPLGGMLFAAIQPDRIATQTVGVPAALSLLADSLVLAVTAAIGALVMGLAPAVVLGAARGGRYAFLLGLILAPLLIPAQVYAYAWTLLPLNRYLPWMSESLKAGLISAGWLWPISSLILAAGWRGGGQAVYTLAVLDTSGSRAFFRAVLPSLRAHFVAAAAVVFAVTLLEYPIPHLCQARVWATETMLLFDVGAPPGQIIHMAAQPTIVILILFGAAAWSLRSGKDWDEIQLDGRAVDAALPQRVFIRRNRLVVFGAATVWLISVAVPTSLMIANLRRPQEWWEGFVLFADEWAVSLGVAAATGLVAVATAVATALGRHAGMRTWLRWPALAAAAMAVIPPAALGVGLIVFYNGMSALDQFAPASLVAGKISLFFGNLYMDSPIVWILGLAGRYTAIAIVICWLTASKGGMVAAEQARVDGAGALDILTAVLLPALWPALLAAWLIVALLSLFEVVVTHLAGPIGYPSIALTILNHMHYGRDDVVIIVSLTVLIAGILITQICARLFVQVAKRTY